VCAIKPFYNKDLCRVSEFRLMVST